MHFETNVETGGLMFYGPDFRAMFHRAADLVDKITLRKRYELVITRLASPYQGESVVARR